MSRGVVGGVVIWHECGTGQYIRSTDDMHSVGNSTSSTSYVMRTITYRLSISSTLYMCVCVCVYRIGIIDWL